jgi:formylglycine-generating enzyme required for sulfatase activity
MLVVTLAGMLALQSRGQGPVITAFKPGEQLSWTGSIAGVVEYCIQGADYLAAATWTNEHIGIVPTGSMMSVTIPGPPGNRYYRLMAVTNLREASYNYLVLDLSGGTNTATYPASYLSAVPAEGWTDEYKTTKIAFRRIPAGTYMMGSPVGELGRENGEPQHQVTLTQPFYIGVFEVTQRQWERVMGTWPSYFKNANYRDTRPVEYVNQRTIRGNNVGTNWPAHGNVDADSFMGRLRARTGWAFDLPTEAQWEYACRAGTGTALNTGYNLTSGQEDTHMSEVGRYWFNGGQGGSNGDVDTSLGTTTVGSYIPNAWGLYDMHGNVWEWCLDWSAVYPAGAATNPPGPASSPYTSRVYRGGAYGHPASACRSAARGGSHPTGSYSPGVGFRAALPLNP